MGGFLIQYVSEIGQKYCLYLFLLAGQHVYLVLQKQFSFPLYLTYYQKNIIERDAVTPSYQHIQLLVIFVIWLHMYVQIDIDRCLYTYMMSVVHNTAADSSARCGAKKLISLASTPLLLLLFQFAICTLVAYACVVWHLLLFLSSCLHRDDL